MITPATCWNVENPPQIAATPRLRDSWPGSWGLQLENRFADLVPTSEHYFVLRKFFPFQFRLQAVEIRITGAKNGCFWLWCFSQPFIRCRVATAGPRYTHCTGGVLGCVSGVWGPWGGTVRGDLCCSPVVAGEACACPQILNSFSSHNRMWQGKYRTH